MLVSACQSAAQCMTVLFSMMHHCQPSCRSQTALAWLIPSRDSRQAAEAADRLRAAPAVCMHLYAGQGQLLPLARHQALEAGLADRRLAPCARHGGGRRDLGHKAAALGCWRRTGLGRARRLLLTPKSSWRLGQWWGPVLQCSGPTCRQVQAQGCCADREQGSEDVESLTAVCLLLACNLSLCCLGSRSTSRHDALRRQ